MFFWLLLCSFVGICLNIFCWKNPVVMQKVGHVFGTGACFLLQVKIIYEKEDRERMEASKPCIYVMNHQSGLDVSIWGKIYPNRTVIVGKKEILWIPIFGIFFYLAGSLLLNRKNKSKAIESMDYTIQRMKKEKLSVIIFPEGTRNQTENDFLPFKKGAFHMAVKSQHPIVPIVISSTRHFASEKKSLLLPGTLKVKVLDPISVIGKKEEDITELMDTTRKQMLQTFQSLNHELDIS